MAAAHGLPMDAALASVTLWPAQILGLGDQLGSLEPGKRATLLLTDGNPLDVTTRIDSAYIDGRLIDLSNKQIKLYCARKTSVRSVGREDEALGIRHWALEKRPFALTPDLCPRNALSPRHNEPSLALRARIDAGVAHLLRRWESRRSTRQKSRRLPHV